MSLGPWRLAGHLTGARAGAHREEDKGAQAVWEANVLLKSRGQGTVGRGKETLTHSGDSTENY